MDSGKLVAASGLQPFRPWPLDDALTPTDREWHFRRPADDPGSAERLVSPSLHESARRNGQPLDRLAGTATPRRRRPWPRHKGKPYPRVYSPISLVRGHGWCRRQISKRHSPIAFSLAVRTIAALYLHCFVQGGSSGWAADVPMARRDAAADRRLGQSAPADEVIAFEKQGAGAAATAMLPPSGQFGLFVCRGSSRKRNPAAVGPSIGF